MSWWIWVVILGVISLLIFAALVYLAIQSTEEKIGKMIDKRDKDK